MSEQESNQIDKMFRQHTEMYEMLADMREALVGNPTYSRPGIIDDIKHLKKSVDDHDKSDNDRFEKIFEYQKKQTLFVGWTGIAVKSIWAIALIALTYYLPKIFG